MADPQPVAGKRKLGCWIAVLVSPFVCCFLWLFAQWGYEAFELKALEASVDDSKIPGTLISKDGRNDWPFNSNGAFVRITWVIVSNEPPKLNAFANEIRSKNPDLNVDLWNMGVAPKGLIDEAIVLIERDPEFHLYILRVSYVRDQQFWEVPA